MEEGTTIAPQDTSGPDSVRDEPLGALHLYDLSDPTRLASTTAESFVLPPIGDDPRILDCSHGAAVPRPPTTMKQ